MEEIKLNKENQITYDNLIRYLNDSNRVAIIQPTGTGKSMVTLKYLQNNSNKKTLYITSYNLNVKNVKDKIEQYGGFGQVEIINYRNFILNSVPENDYDVIILDEFHHCGADVTSVMLEKLFSKYPNAKVIGTTATPIRYLDNQRDMTEELFGDITARDMSLSYAVANKILPEFTYVAGLYDYNYSELLQEYTHNVNKIDGEELEYYLSLINQLSKYLTKASGINEILKKHIKPTGKYVVFCDNKEQIEEIIAKINKKELNWFDGIDLKPEIYSVYYGNDGKENIENFELFKKSKSNHLKLLFNINMASEGMHLSDITGVIMFRKTASMNVYLQQLGRALAVDTETNPIIFDFANNISNQFIYEFIRETTDEIKKGIDDKKTDIADIRKIKVFDEIKEINEVLSKLNSVPINDWDKQFYKIYQMKDLLFSYTYNADGTEFLDISKLDIIENLIDVDLLKWLKKQILDYQNNRLSYPKIKKLQILGVIIERGQFNEEDKEIFDNFCSQILPAKENIDSQLSNLPFEQQMFLIKNFIKKYYFRKNNQNYTMEDYIQCCLMGLYNARNIYNKNGSYKQHVEKCIMKEIARSLSSEKECLSLDDISSMPMELDEETLINGSIDKAIIDVINVKLKKDLENRVIDLTEKQKKVISYRYGLYDGRVLTLQQIADILHITRGRVGVIEREAIIKLRRNLRKFSDSYVNSIVK